ncbi:MFS transporter [Paraburkholderia elongata]|uniref:MFS transporter n=1 Tax=Paraburkholderia elongata TaxID=2675747 RepID=A0A972NQR5_9BURK|nr:MFS transporter [Paraburkholderia elongata]NPT57301.1 MFS transporter [Paraburkholderia elongata]
MMITFIIGFMDRTNVGFAIPSVGSELALTSAVFGFASGMLFPGYGIAQPICGWLADRGYGKALINVTMVLWGIAELSQSMVHNASQLVAVRFAIDLFEGGIFPDLPAVREELVRAF